jgi:hypothetical protein
MDEFFDRGPLTRRELAFDLLPHDEVQALLPHLNLAGSDSEMFDLEHRDSHERLNAVQPILPLIQIFSSLTAETFNLAYLQPEPDEDESVKARREAFNKQNLAVIQSSFIAILAQFIQMGVVAIDPDVYVMKMEPPSELLG